MVRRVDEPVEVRTTQDDGRLEGGLARPGREAVGAPPEGRPSAPTQFLWRGRLYRVTEVVDSWQERRDWWREALSERPLGEVSTARQVWRVQARAGRSAAPGIYDLGHDGGWRLLQTQD